MAGRVSFLPDRVQSTRWGEVPKKIKHSFKHIAHILALIGDLKVSCAYYGGIPVRLVPDVIMGHENMTILEEQLRVFKTNDQ